MSNSSGQPRESSYQVAALSEEAMHSSSKLPTRQITYDALVLEARLRQSLVTVRSLGSRGLRVAAMEASGDVPTFASRWCQQAFVCPIDGSAEARLSCLEQLLELNGVRVLITSTDANVALIRAHRARLEQRVHIALAKEPALGIACDKERTLEVARQLGLGIPRAITVRDASEVGAALREVGLPAVVKPVQSWVWGNQHGVALPPRLVVTPNEAQSVVEELLNLGIAILFQQFLPGKREAVSFLYAGGRIYARFAQWAKRTLPPLGGTSVLRQSIAVPQDIGIQAERLVREIELEGYSEVEFRRDITGNPYLMEINPRLSASVEIAVRSGVDFPYLLYQWASGDKIDVVTGYRVGGWMRYLGGDLQTTILAIHQRGRPGVTPPAKAIFDFCSSFFIPARYDTVDWKDPLPAWRAAASFARYWSRRVGKRLFMRRPQRVSRSEKQ